MNYVLFICLIIVSGAHAMDNSAWDVEKLATRMANQRRADDKVFIHKVQAIAQKNPKDLTNQEQYLLTELAGSHKTFCLLELVLVSPLFKQKEMEAEKDFMLNQAISAVSTGLGLCKRRARVLKNVELLLQHGAGQDERRFKSIVGSYYIFKAYSVSEGEFKVGEITPSDHLKLIGLCARYLKHSAFKSDLENELRTNKDRDWAIKVAHVAIENGMDQSLMHIAQQSA